MNLMNSVYPLKRVYCYIIECSLLYWEMSCDAQNRGTHVWFPPSQLLEESLCNGAILEWAERTLWVFHTSFKAQSRSKIRGRLVSYRWSVQDLAAQCCLKPLLSSWKFCQFLFFFYLFIFLPFLCIKLLNYTF